jgi:hypothetical protein
VLWIRIFGAVQEEMAAANKRQPPHGYPTRGNIVEASQIDNNIKDENETDRGISGRIMIGRPKSRSHERYPGPGLVHFDDYGPVQPHCLEDHTTVPLAMIILLLMVSTK